MKNNKPILGVSVKRMTVLFDGAKQAFDKCVDESKSKTISEHEFIFAAVLKTTKAKTPQEFMLLGMMTKYLIDCVESHIMQHALQHLTELEQGIRLETKVKKRAD